MKILAVDTSTRSCSVAIVENDTILVESILDIGQTHSKHLMKMIDGVLNLNHMPLDEIDGFAASTGPGSFTGLRIGISTIKGIAAKNKKPVFGVSSLDALAFQCYSRNSLVCVLIDARKKEIYCSRYRTDSSGIISKVQNDGVMSPEKAIWDINEPCLFLGNGALLYKDFIVKQLGNLAIFPPIHYHIIKASSVARLALTNYDENSRTPADNIKPHYIRPSDAEKNAKAG